jgi:hypothetical protein
VHLVRILNTTVLPYFILLYFRLFITSFALYQLISELLRGEVVNSSEIHALFEMHVLSPGFFLKASEIHTLREKEGQITAIEPSFLAHTVQLFGHIMCHTLQVKGPLDHEHGLAAHKIADVRCWR